MVASLGEIDYPRFLAADMLVIFRFGGVLDHLRQGIRNSSRQHLPRDHFIAILRSLKEEGTPISLDDFLAIGRAGRGLPEFAFAVTFDVGFANNLEVAAPILEDLRIPATFYLTTGLVGTSEGLWIDQVEYAVERVEEVRLEGLPDPTLNGRYTSLAEKVGLLEKVRRVVGKDPAIDPKAFAREVWRQLGIASMEPEPQLDRKLSWSEAKELARSSLFRVGGHGHTYVSLASLSPGDLQTEVSTSRSLLERHLGERPRHYSYPQGTDQGVSARVIDSLNAHGFVCAPTQVPGVNRVGDDPFRLKRITVV